jgi:hypothetical protein
MGQPFPLIPEEDLSNFELSGTCTVWETAPEIASNIINTNQDWGVIFDWKTSGSMAGSLSGTWTVWVYLERMGPLEGPNVPSEDEPFVAASSAHNYSKTIKIAKNTVPVGLYKLTTAVTMRGPNPDQIPTPIAMLGDGPLIQVYKVP